RRVQPSDPADATALAADLDGLALALEQAGAFIAKHRTTVAEYRGRWRQQEQKVLEWFDKREMKYTRSVAKTWQTSFAALRPEGRALLQVLSWLAPEPVPRRMVEELPPDDAGIRIDVESALADLETYSFLRWEQGAQAFRIHRLVQEMTRYQAAPTEPTRGL